MKHKLWALAALLLMAIPLSANAHEELVDQYPAAGESIPAGVQEVRLSFTNELLELAGGAGNEIVVRAPSGEIFYAGCLPTLGADGVLPVDLDEPGRYSVAWRVVSADGHPISDGFEFTVVNETGYQSDPAFSYPDCAGDVDITIQEEQPQSLYWLLWSSMGIAAAFLVFLLRPKARSKKHQSGEQ